MSSFPRPERLKSRTLISTVFEKKEVVVRSGEIVLLAKRLQEGTDEPFQVLFSVPKRNFSKAVDRNSIKRHMRECFRSAKSNFQLKLQNQSNFAFVFVYRSKKRISFESMRNHFNRLAHDFGKRCS